MKSQRISAVLAVHHEEQQLEACLKSIASVVDEIFVVHDGPCKDQSVAIAKKYTKRVMILPKNAGSAEFVRFHALSKIKTDWVLLIDADERLSKDAQHQLRKLVQDDTADAYSFAWPFFDVRGKCLEKRTKRRKTVLFRMREFYHIALPHMVGGTRGRCVHLDLILEHHFSSLQQQQLNVWADVKKNRSRARQAAKILLTKRGPKRFQCTAHEALPYNKKIKLQITFPLLSLVSLPLYSFLYCFIKRGYLFDGLRGLQNSLNVASYHAFLPYYIMKQRKSD